MSNKKEKKVMIENNFIIGLDLSLSCTGIVVYDISKREFVYIGHIDTEHIKKKKDIYHNAMKLKYIYDELSRLKELYPPRVVLIERGFSRFPTSTQVIYRVHGLANFIFHEFNQIYYPPKTIKEAIWKGDATKVQVQQIIINNVPGVVFANEDESDAYAVVITYLLKNDMIEWEKPPVPIKKKRVAKKKKEEL